MSVSFYKAFVFCCVWFSPNMTAWITIEGFYFYSPSVQKTLFQTFRFSCNFSKCCHVCHDVAKVGPKYRQLQRQMVVCRIFNYKHRQSYPEVEMTKQREELIRGKWEQLKENQAIKNGYGREERGKLKEGKKLYTESWAEIYGRIDRGNN